jgi:hypothetical protein
MTIPYSPPVKEDVSQLLFCHPELVSGSLKLDAEPSSA